MRWLSSDTFASGDNARGLRFAEATLLRCNSRSFIREANATALAFDPPVFAGTPRVDLSRDGRGPTAFEGFDEGARPITSCEPTTCIQILRPAGGGGADNPDNYQSPAVSETYGISYH